MAAPSRTRILAASAVMLGAIAFIIVDRNHEAAQAALEVADKAVLLVRGDSLFQSAAVAARAAADDGSETLFYMESLIPLIVFLFCIPFKSLATFSKAGDKKVEPQLLDWVALAQAAKRNDEKKFEELVSECGPNEQDSWGVSLLHTAALGGSAAITKSLLQRGANHSVCDFCEDTPLHYAARGGCAEVCQLLIDAGAKAARNLQDWTPLLVAAHAGHHQACKLFFDAGFEVGATDCELPPLLQALIFEKLICGLPRTPQLTMTDDLDEVLSEVSYDEGFF